MVVRGDGLSLDELLSRLRATSGLGRGKEMNETKKVIGMLCKKDDERTFFYPAEVEITRTAENMMTVKAGNVSILFGIDDVAELLKASEVEAGNALDMRCDDAISRDMALEKMADYVASGYADSVEDFEEYSRIICQLSSITQKSGKWIPNYYFYGIYDYTCSECEKHSKERSKFCHNCGAKMESEVRNDKNET